MSKKFLYFASILLTIIVGTVLFWYFCCGPGGQSSDKEAAAADTAMAPDQQVTEPITPAPDSSAMVDWAAIKEQLNDQAPIVRFEAYQTESILQQDNMNQLEQIIDYLENNPDEGLLVTGHADISGARALNMTLSEKRAAFFKNYLVQNGIDADKITTSFKGPDDPIADNNTAEGRAKNRRAVVIIK
jgi:outer membrane protein OmpA-like peptidoglycan-associated protein